MRRGEWSRGGLGVASCYEHVECFPPCWICEIHRSSVSFTPWSQGVILDHQSSQCSLSELSLESSQTWTAPESWVLGKLIMQEGLHCRYTACIVQCSFLCGAPVACCCFLRHGCMALWLSRLQLGVEPGDCWNHSRRAGSAGLTGNWRSSRGRWRSDVLLLLLSSSASLRPHRSYVRSGIIFVEATFPTAQIRDSLQPTVLEPVFSRGNHLFLVLVSLGMAVHV